jgi:hypothetical protein
MRAGKTRVAYAGRRHVCQTQPPVAHDGFRSARIRPVRGTAKTVVKIFLRQARRNPRYIALSAIFSNLFRKAAACDESPTTRKVAIKKKIRVQKLR